MEATLAGLPLPLRFMPAQPLSDDELIAFSRANQGFPVERDAEGYVVVMSPTGLEGSRRNLEILLELGLWNRREGHGVVTESDGGFTLPDGSVRAPDAAWTAADRFNALPAQERKRFARISPDFIIELRSPSDIRLELEEKMDMWMRNGVALAWLIDPEERTVTIYRPDQASETLGNISQVSGEGPIAGFILPLDRVFT